MTKEFFKFVIPSMLAFALSGVYAIADGFFVGNALGDGALAAINIAFPVTALMQSAGTGIGMAGAIQYALCSGTGDEVKKKKYLVTTLWLLIISALLMTALFLTVNESLLVKLGAKDEILIYGKEYVRFVAYGAIFQVLGTGTVPIIRNMGNSMMAMLAMVAGFITNILLDYLLVWVIPCGMMGAAFATVFGQAVTFIFCIIFVLYKNRGLKFFPKWNRELAGMIKKILIVAISPFGLTFSPNITLILINKSAAVYGGNLAVTCYAAVSYISYVVLLLLQGVSDGSQPLISISYGLGDWAKAKKFRNLAYKFSALIAVVSTIIIVIIRDHAAALFGASLEVSQNVARILPLFVAGYIFSSYSRMTTSYFYATEKNKLAYILIYGEPVCLFIGLMILPPIFGITGTWIAVPLSQFCAMMIGIFEIVFYDIKRKNNRKEMIE